MQSLEFSGWRIAFDPDATRRATARMSCGAAEACGCDGCRAFAAQRAELLGPELATLLARLGVDSAWEWEVEPLGKERGGGRTFRAAWRFVGRVLEAPACPGPITFRDDAGADGPAVLVELVTS